MAPLACSFTKKNRILRQFSIIKELIAPKLTSRWLFLIGEIDAVPIPRR